MPRTTIDGSVIVLTGATGGLGRALAAALRRKGALLVLLDQDDAALAEMAGDLGDADVVRHHAVDVRSLPSVEEAMAAAAAAFGGIDVVIAGAGVGPVASLTGMDPEAFERTIDINLSGVWRTFRAGLPHVAERRGYLLSISSMAAFIHSPLHGAYAASKAGVWAMTDSVRLEVRHLGVDVGSVHPTFFRTPMTDQVLEDPVGRRLWGEHRHWPWRMVSRDAVVDAIVGAVERRAALTVVPRRLELVARAAGVARPFVDRLGWRRNDIPGTMALAGRTAPER